MRKVHVTGAFIACLVSLAVGFWVGLQQAFRLGEASHFLLRGAIATQNLEALRARRIEAVATNLEFEVDMGLLAGGNFLDSPLRRLLVPPFGGHTPLVYYEQRAMRLATYRLQHASPFDSASEPRAQAIIDERIKRYAEMASDRAVVRHPPKSDARPSP